MYNPLLALIIGLIGIGIILVVFWPERGLYSRWKRSRRVTQRVLREDALKHIHRAERGGYRPTVQSVAGDLDISTDDAAELLTDMTDMGLIASSNGDFTLTPAGQESALHIIRAHRLWERYLADETGFSEAEWHAQAEYLEHELEPSDANALSAQLGNPLHDPHGDPIPTASGDLVTHGGIALPALELGTAGRIVHLEDEPEIVYSQLVAMGLHPGLDILIIDKTDQRVRFWADGNEHVLAPLIAANISVIAAPEKEKTIETLPGERLWELKAGEKAEVAALSRAARNVERRRLMDLGILPGVTIENAFTSPSGDPTAYLVRDTLIALRKEQANYISIRRPDQPAPVSN